MPGFAVMDHCRGKRHRLLREGKGNLPGNAGAAGMPGLLHSSPGEEQAQNSLIKALT